MKQKKENFLEKLVDRIFSLKKIHVYLLLIFVLGFVLRFIAAINLGVKADDMHFVTHAINFLSADKLVTYDQSSGLWFAFTDLMYGFFGFTQLASRFAPLIFGSFSIFLIFLITKDFFNEKAGMIAAFLLAIAPFHIKNTIAGMDVMAMFFVLGGMYLFLKADKNKKFSLFAISGVFMGLAIYTKVYPLLFIPSLLLYFAYSQKKDNKEIFSKDNLKLILVFLAVIFIFTIPAITHNSLLYKEKGFMDLQFTRTLGLGEDVAAQYYSWDPIWGRSNSWSGLIFGDTDHISSGKPLLLASIDFIRISDPINFYLGVLGLLFIIFNKKESKKYPIFFLLSILFILPFLGSIILLGKHFIFLEILLIPSGAFLIVKAEKKIFKQKKPLFLFALLALMLLLSLILLGNPSSGRTSFYAKSDVSQIIEFKDDLIDPNSLIISDSRIYRGTTHWISQGRPYLEGSEFISFLQQQQNIPGELIPVKVFYIECVLDDCGWGNVKDQPEFNASMEQLTEIFKQNGVLEKEILEPSKKETHYPLIEKDKINSVNIYSSTLSLNQAVFSLGTQPKNWFLYSIGYEPRENQFDYFSAKGLLDSLLHSLAQWIVIFSLILSFVSLAYVVYLVLE